MLRVVFDTNAFSPGNFELLEQGPMRKLCRNGRIEPVYGHVFLEETMRAYSSERRRQDLVTRWLPFIAETAKHIGNDFVEIWHSELVQGRGPDARIHMEKRKFDRLMNGLRNVPADGSWPAWHASLAAREEEDRKRAAQRATSTGIRDDVASWRKRVSYDPKRHGESNLERYQASELEYAGRSFIGAQVKAHDVHAVANRWARDPDQYPYFTTFVRNMLYIAHHAMTKPNDSIDLNAQADLDLMTHLLHADMLVSNEMGFLRSAFGDIWRPRGKVLFTSQEFAAFIPKL